MLWFDHGEHPKNASYHYIVVPNVTEAEWRDTSQSDRRIEILVNTPEIQAVRHSKLDICQIAFYEAGAVAISKDTTVRMNSQGMAMVKMNGEVIEALSVSDPSRQLHGMTLTVPGLYHSKRDHFVTKPNTQQNETQVLIDLPQGVYAGKSVTVKL